MKSEYLQCPLPSSFFADQKKKHSSQIRRAVHQAWGMNSQQLQQILRARLQTYGYICISDIRSSWQEAFQYAEDWNRYEGVSLDRKHMQEQLETGLWSYQAYTIQLDIPTLLTIASLAFESDAEKESPNHLFLKELGRLIINRVHKDVELQEEVYLKVYDQSVRCDIIAKEKGDVTCVGEVGGVQLWKVLGLLHQGKGVFVLPHWTRQKTNPFIRKRLSYSCFHFLPKGGEYSESYPQAANGVHV